MLLKVGWHGKPEIDSCVDLRDVQQSNSRIESLCHRFYVGPEGMTHLGEIHGKKDVAEGCHTVLVRQFGDQSDTGEPVKLALWVQKGRIRVFRDGEKQLDFNQVDLPAIDTIEMAHDFYGANQAIGYRMVRFVESTPDFSQVINSASRFVTHGILFDTDSDRLKPESAPVIQSIARSLDTNPNLRLLIEGHTDSAGNAAHNLELSKRRAEAVKTVLVITVQGGHRPDHDRGPGRHKAPGFQRHSAGP